MKPNSDWVWLGLGLVSGALACSAQGSDIPGGSADPYSTSGGASDGTGGFPGQNPNAGGYVANPGPPQAGGAQAGGGTQNGAGGMQMGGSGGSGSAGMPPMGGTTGMGGSVAVGSGGSTVQGAGGAGAGGSGAGGMMTQGSGGQIGGGDCCDDGNCLCHGPAPTGLTSRNGPFQTTTFNMGTIAQVYYPTDADPPFAGIAIVPGFLNSGPEMRPWGAFYASHGIVCAVTNTLGSDDPNIRATKLLAAVDGLKAENTKSGSPLNGKMSDRYGTSGYSMGGGGTTIATMQNKTLKTSIGLAAWGPNATGVTTATLLLCGDADIVAPCNMTDTAYAQVTDPTPKMKVVVPGATHFNWFGPTDTQGGMSGETALAFQKVYLEGDTRWKPLLLQSKGTVTTNIK